MKRNNLFAAAAFAAVSLGAAVAAQAELVAYDPFLSGGNRGAGEYTAGTDMRTMGAAALGWQGGPPDGFGVSHAGSTGNFLANALGEDSAAVTYEQGGRMQWLGVGNFPFNRNLTRQLNPTPSSSEWWMSIMVNRLGWADSADHTFAVGGFTDAGGNGLQVGYGNANGTPTDDTPDLILRSNGVDTTLLADAPSSDNQYVLLKLEIDPAGNDTISVWTDPASVAPLGVADVVITDQDLTSSLAPFTQSKYESPGQSGAVFFDEIRLGTDLISVTGVPEPTSVVLGLLGLGLTCARRRR